MSKKPTIHVDIVNFQIIEGLENTKVEVYRSWFNGKPILEFWVPSSTRDRFGFVPSEILKARCKQNGIMYNYHTLATRYHPDHPKLISNQQRKD